MSKVIQYQSPWYMSEVKQNYEFRNQRVPIRTEDGDTIQFPCIVLYDRETNIPVAYPGYERWLFQLNQSERKATTTLNKKAYNLCAFLNYILWNTQADSVCEVTNNDIRDFIADFRTIDDEPRDTSGWERGVADVYDFLNNYYDSYHDRHPFNYDPKYLVSTEVVRNAETRRKSVVKKYNYLSVRPPRKDRRKNRYLLRGYLDLFLYECMKYDPMLTLGVALQAFAGLREGEVVNLTCDSIKFFYAGFGGLQRIILDLTHEAPHAKSWTKTSLFGSIKVYRKQEVYTDFLSRVYSLFNEHQAMLRNMGYDIEGDAPLFVNHWGGPMSVTSYSARIRNLFKQNFLPDLKKYCELEGIWPENAAYIEEYMDEYPGAHMFRHWYTMYLIEKTNLTPDEIAKWRGDSSRESMLDYIHINADMLKMYRESAFSFQESVMAEVL